MHVAEQLPVTDISLLFVMEKKKADIMVRSFLSKILPHNENK
jgi:hypothetical protein